MTELLTAFRGHLVGRRRAPRTVETYETIATAFIATTTGSQVTAAHVEAFLGRTRLDGVRRSAAGHNQELAVLRSLSTYAVRERYWRKNPTKDIPFVRDAPHDPEVLTIEETHHLFSAAAEKPPAGEGPQMLAILAVLSQTALRVHELVALNVDQVNLLAAKLHGVKGKGDTVHSLDLNGPTVALLMEWLRERVGRAPPDEKALFISSRRSRLSIRTVENWFVHLRSAMGTTRKITPHTLRHTAATQLLSMGANLPTVSQLLRHTDIRTTLRYIHIVNTERRDAVHRLAVAVPATVLPPSASNTPVSKPVENLPKYPVPMAPDAPVTFPHSALDDQYGLVAKPLREARHGENDGQYGMVAA